MKGIHDEIIDVIFPGWNSYSINHGGLDDSAASGAFLKRGMDTRGDSMRFAFRKWTLGAGRE